MSGRAPATSNSDHQSPITGGEFLLSLLQNHHHHSPSPLPLPHQQNPNPNPNHLNIPIDPAVAAVGPPLPLTHHHYRHHQSTPSPAFPPNFFLHGSSFPQNPRGTHNQSQSQSLRVPPGFENKKSGRSGNDAYMFGSFPFRVGNESLDGEVASSNSRVDMNGLRDLGIGGGGDRGSGVSSRDMTGRGGGNGNRLSGFEGRNVDRLMGFAGNVNRGVASSRVDANQGRELCPSDPFRGNHDFMSRKGYEPRELGSSDPFQGNRESVTHRGFDSRESGISDPFNGNHDLMSHGGFVRSDARWRTDSGGRPSGRNEGFEPNVGGERYRDSNDEFSHRGFHSSERNYGRERRFGDGDRDRDRDRHGLFRGSGEVALRSQLDRPGPLAGSRLHLESAPRIEEAIMNLHSEVDVNGEGTRRLNLDGHRGSDHANGRGGDDIDELSDQFAESSVAEDESNGKHNEKKHNFHDKDFRTDTRGQQLFSQRMRNLRRLMECRGDIGIFNAPFLTIFESLVPPEEEKTKQKQLLASIEKLVNKEWPDAKLYLYGSCANTFGVSKSDIDVCLAINDQDIEKSEILLKLAEILESNNLQDVQALTRARVPIVKLKDPGTGISCDICINNVLAVVNTKLLRDYAEIDVRLRQLAFIVKHWAKSRDVNATYQGTLSSYAYVLMCIHFLQHRRPAILPCLQAMPPTYKATVEEVECAFFDQVEKLRDFGAHNREGIAQLVWGFFNYWAYRHDYANSVISVRLGTLISKQMKDWTRRIGNDRHLICIEDPLEISHDLGRVVDRRSIRVLREEFERAAEILQFDPNPCVTLFQPYIPS